MTAQQQHNMLNTADKTIAIVGLGAIGGPLAARIRQKSDWTVWGVSGRAESAQVLTENGLRVDWNKGTGFEAPVYLHHVVASADELPEGLDLAIIVTKSDALDAVCQALQYKLRPDGLAISLLNGDVLDTVARHFGPQCTGAASVVWSATLNPDRSYTITGEGTFKYGTLAGVNSRLADDAAQLLGLCFPVERTDNIRGALWSKLCINSCITTLGAISGLTFGQQTEQRDIRRLYFRIITETLQVGHAAGYRFEKLNGKLNPVRLSNLKGGLPGFLKHWVIKMMGRKYKGGVSSMLQSLRRGHQPEIDTINGVVVAKGQELRVPTPLHSRMVEMVREIAAGKRPISPDNLKELY